MQTRARQLLCTLSMFPIPVRLQWSFGVEEIAQTIRRAIDTSAHESPQTERTWFSREWLDVIETTHERFLAGLPGMNAFMAICILANVRFA